MTPDLVTAVHFTPASRADREAGLAGYLRFDLAGLVRLDGIALRRTMDNRLVLAFPSRRDRHGVQHDYVRPVDSAARDAITAAAIAALNLQADGGA